MKLFARALAIAALATTLTAANASATTITIDDGTSVGGALGDYYVISPGNGASAPGQVVDILKQQVTPTESGSVTMGALWTYLNSQGVTSANKLLFGLGVNEPNATNQDPDVNVVDITALTMTFNLPSPGLPRTFDLGAGNMISVRDWVNGASAGDALIGVDLNFDFMRTFSSSSTELLTLTSTLGRAEGGFEIYFINSALYDLPNGDGGGLSAVPEPATLTLFGTGLAVIATRVRRRNRTPKQ